MLLGFVCVADGLAMMLPGPSGGLRGAGLALAGLAVLFAGLPKFMSAEGRPFSPVLVTRMGLVALPLICGPIAYGWHVATPAALNGWFAVAWAGVWGACLTATAFLPCPACGASFGRSGARIEIRSSRCAHCGVDARDGEAAHPNADQP